MAVDPGLIAKGVKTFTDLCSDKKVQKMMFGTYSDGKTRSFIDAVNGEILSPKQKKDKIYKKRKSGRKKIRL